MAISANFKSICTHEWEISFLQCYPNGYLKYTELCNLLQLTAGLHAESGGLGFHDMQRSDQAWVLSRMRLEIDDLPKWNDRVSVKTWIIEMYGSRSIRALELYLNGQKIVGAVTYWVVFNTSLRKAENLIQPYKHFMLYPDSLSTSSNFKKIELVSQTETLYEDVVKLSDLDIVNHANNVKYLEWCLNNISTDTILKRQIKAFDMNFIKELYHGDPYKVEKSTTKDAIYYITRNNKVCFALELEYKDEINS